MKLKFCTGLNYLEVMIIWGIFFKMKKNQVD